MKNPNWGDNYYLTLIQLQDEDIFDQANSAIREIYLRNDKHSNSEAILHPLANWHLYGEFENGKAVGGRIDQLKIFIILACCILLIACINFMNLTTAKSGKRAKEVGVGYRPIPLLSESVGFLKKRNTKCCFRYELILGDKINILLSLELLTRVMRFYADFGCFLKTKKPVIVYDYRLLVSFDVYQAEEEAPEPCL